MIRHDWEDEGASAFLRWLRGDAPPPRTLIAFAHPDDETIGAGAVLARLDGVRLLCATDGAPAERRWWGDPSCPSRAAYAALRRRELDAALDVAGIPPGRLVQLAYGDQTLSRGLAELSHRLRDAMVDGVLVVLTHPYEGGHPDHDAVAFAVHAARDLLLREGRHAPEVLEFASYHARGHGLATGAFLDAGDARPVVCALDAAAQARKRRMLDAYASQRETLAPFGVEAEAFRRAPRYDFTAPPHPGTLHYERFDWGCTGAEWRAHAAAALREMGLADGAQAQFAPGG